MNILQRSQKSGVRSQKSFRTPHHELRTTNFPLRTAFTLIELITVIVIILLLSGILLPTIIKAKSLAYLATTRAYITQLETGALRYKQENQVFPGQDNTNILVSATGPGSNPLFTGSQLLGAALFGMELDKTGNDYNGDFVDNPPTSEYVEFKEDRVVNSERGTDTNNLSFVPQDLFPGDDAQAILYYPSRLGNDGSFASFEFEDNENYTGGTNGDPDYYKNFIGLIWDTRFGRGANQANDGSHRTTWGTNLPNTGAPDNKVFNADTFLLFGKGVNNRDHAYSWFTPQSAKNFTSEGYKIPE